MAFLFPKGLEQNRTIQIVLAAILIVLICGFFIYTKVTAPRNDVADGIYRNRCCSDIAIKDGRISYGNKTLVIKIRDMKFGLTGYVNGQFRVEGIRESNEATAISLFNEGGRRALSLPVDGHQYTFRSDDRWKAR